MKSLILSAFILFSFFSQAQENFDTVKIRPLRVAENIYMLTGSGGNIGVLTGSDGVLMIDNQFAPLSDKIKNAIQTLDRKPVRFLINTHLHGDHSGGNENFTKDGVTIFAQEAVRVRMMKEVTDKTSGVKAPSRTKDAWPVVTFSDKLSFHLNNEDVDAYHFSHGHTDGDVVLHFKKANVFHCGDMFVRYGFPYIDVTSGGGVNGFITFLDKILMLMNESSKVIPGHGALATKADVKVFRDMMSDVRDQVASALRKGKKAEDIPAMGITDKYEKVWGGGFIKGKDFVLLIAENIKAGI